MCSSDLALLICAVLAVAGAICATGIRNTVLSGEPEPEPGAPECLSCRMDGPPVDTQRAVHSVSRTRN